MTSFRGWPSFKCITPIKSEQRLRLTGWTNNRYSIDAAGSGGAGLLVVSERLVPQSS